MCGEGICAGCRASERRKQKHGDYAGVVDIARNGIDRVNKLEKELQATNKGAERNAKIARRLADENVRLRRALKRIAGFCRSEHTNCVLVAQAALVDADASANAGINRSREAASG